MTYEEFKKDVLDFLKDKPKEWRDGQAIFNYINEKYKVARYVQFMEGIDCFFNDKMIEAFIKASYEAVLKKNAIEEDYDKQLKDVSVVNKPMTNSNACSLPEVLQESRFVVEFTKGVELFSWKVKSFLVCRDFASFDLLVLSTDKPDDTVNYLLEHREKETLVDFKVTFLDATGVACYTKEYKNWKIQDAELQMYGDTSSKNPLTINFHMSN
jgi:hypothetical protein